MPRPAIRVDVGPLKLVGLAVVVDRWRRQEPRGRLQAVRVGHAARWLPRARRVRRVLLLIGLAQHPSATSSAAPLTLWSARHKRWCAFLELAILVPLSAAQRRLGAGVSASRGLEVERRAPKPRAARSLCRLRRGGRLPGGAPANINNARRWLGRRIRRGGRWRRRWGAGARRTSTEAALRPTPCVEAGLVRWRFCECRE